MTNEMKIIENNEQIKKDFLGYKDEGLVTVGKEEWVYAPSIANSLEKCKVGSSREWLTWLTKKKFTRFRLRFAR